MRQFKTDMGGPNAMISVEQSVADMRKVIDGLIPADTGKFIGNDGVVVLLLDCADALVACNRKGKRHMEIYVYWFLLALVLVGLEIVTGTFYLLVIAVALAVGGVSATLGASLAWQFVLGAVTGVAGTVMLRRWKSSQTSKTPEVGLDIGLPVKVIKWNDDGTARVNYRGAEWDAELESADTPREGTLYIAAVRGSGLVLTHRKQQ